MESSSQAFVSVIMPCRNAEKYLRQAIESILNQTLRNYEVIIIDDASTDSSKSIIDNYIQNDKIVYIRNEKNMGVAASLNKGILRSKGKYIARMDADDISEPDRLEIQADYMTSHPNCIVCGTDIILIDEKNKVIGRRIYQHDDSTIKKRLLRNNPFAHPATMIRKNILFDKNIFYTDDYPRAEDYHLWLRLAEYGEFCNLNRFLLQYRITDQAVKNIYCKEMLLDTIRLKKKFYYYADIVSYFIYLIEIIFVFFPKNTVFYFFKLKNRGNK